jgi:GTP-binding protein SAR1
MFLVNWFYDALGYFGLYKKNGKLIFLGLDNAGKTTLLQMMKDERIGQQPPTLHPQAEELVMGNVRFRTFDLGGHEIARRIWADYFAKVDGVVYMVDAADSERFGLARSELENLLNCEELRSTPFVILGNKIDMPDAVSEDELRSALGLPFGHTKAADGTRPIELYMCSVARKMGYADGIRWLAQFLK